MKDAIRDLAFAALILAGFAGLIYFAARQPIAPEVRERIDTVYVENTVYKDRPIYIRETVIRHDTLLLAHTDTVHTVDTLYLPITERYYEEQDGRLRIWISGYKPTLERYELDEQTRVITKTVETRRRVGFSITGGPALIHSVISGELDAGFGIVAGISYTF